MYLIFAWLPILVNIILYVYFRNLAVVMLIFGFDLVAVGVSYDYHLEKKGIKGTDRQNEYLVKHGNPPLEACLILFPLTIIYHLIFETRNISDGLLYILVSLTLLVFANMQSWEKLLPKKATDDVGYRLFVKPFQRVTLGVHVIRLILIVMEYMVEYGAVAMDIDIRYTVLLHAALTSLAVDALLVQILAVVDKSRSR